MFRALLAHPQEALHKTALGVLRAGYVSWLRHQLVQPSVITSQVRCSKHVAELN
jgi:hypothetical protein